MVLVQREVCGHEADATCVFPEDETLLAVAGRLEAGLKTAVVFRAPVKPAGGRKDSCAVWVGIVVERAALGRHAVHLTVVDGQSVTPCSTSTQRHLTLCKVARGLGAALVRVRLRGGDTRAAIERAAERERRLPQGRGPAVDVGPPAGGDAHASGKAEAEGTDEDDDEDGEEDESPDAAMYDGYEDRTSSYGE